MHPLRPTLFVAAVLSMMGASSAAPGRHADNPLALQRVLDCRALTDDRARLACFDAGVAQIDAARASGDLVVVDREEVRKTRRGLFGFSLPSLAIFGGHRDGDPRQQAVDDELKEITGKITAVGRNADGGWIITLEDGARWEQTQAMTFGRSPRPGATATIKRAALGSYKMSIDGSPSVKARRIG